MSPSQDRGWERSPERGKRSQTGGRWRQVQSPGRSLEPQRTELSEGVLGKEDRGPGSPGRSLSDLETLCRAGRILFLASPWSLQEIPATHSCPVRRGFAESSEMEVKEWSDYRKGKRGISVPVGVWERRCSDTNTAPLPTLRNTGAWDDKMGCEGIKLTTNSKAIAKRQSGC